MILIAAVVSAIVTIGMGLITNELHLLAPEYAQRIIRRTARIQATSRDEADLLYAEYLPVLAVVPGNLGKLAWSIGLFAGASRDLCRLALKRRVARVRGQVSPEILADALPMWWQRPVVTRRLEQPKHVHDHPIGSGS